MNEKEFKHIIEKYRKGLSGKSEQDHLQEFERHFDKKNGASVFKSPWHKSQIQKSIFTHVKKKIDPSYANWYWMVAVVSILVTTGIFYWQSSTVITSPALVNISTHHNQVKTIVLQDSSKVTLNENSVLEFPKSFSDTVRYVRLHGEAYFKIKHDATRPFKVYADRMITEVLGTEFNINTRHQASSVALVSGSVNVSGLGVSKVLGEKQKIEFDKVAHTSEVTTFDPQLELFWKHQQLIFNNKPLGEIVRILEDQFKTPIHIEDQSLLNLAITGTFKGKGLSTILLSLSKAADFEFKGLKEKRVTIYKPQ